MSALAIALIGAAVVAVLGVLSGVEWKPKSRYERELRSILADLDAVREGYKGARADAQAIEVEIRRAISAAEATPTPAPRRSPDDGYRMAVHTGSKKSPPKGSRGVPRKPRPHAGREQRDRELDEWIKSGAPSIIIDGVRHSRGG